MSKGSTTEAACVAAASDVHAQGWEHALEAALSVLKDIDARYEQDRAGIAESTITGQTRTCLLQELDLRHQREREPYVLTVADLHERIMEEILSRAVH
jgi:hypothetical protein